MDDWDVWIEWDHGIIWPTVLILRHPTHRPRRQSGDR